ncbi:MAG TPA: diguanylate cyclase [Thermoleophilaceae bacterium]|nr:diguanylate cyclase [Thermoleophilaceae bacterium]
MQAIAVPADGWVMRGSREKEELQQRLEAACRQIAALQSQLQMHSGRDPLTGLLELTPFMNSLVQELSRAGRYGRPVSVVRVDIDNFEAVNVEYGRAAGDRVLTTASRMIAGQTRAQDIVCRVAGDQFALLLPETDAAGAAVCAERILAVLERLSADGVEGLRASAGVAPFERGQSAERLLAAAGAALRQAQEGGGGRVALSGAAGAAEYVRGDAALALMAALSERDAWTAAHARAVGNLAATLAQKLGLSAEADTIRTAALLHDIGKMAIPDVVLNKPLPLDDAEWSLMREVPLAGERILRSVPGMGAAARVIRHVHERWDGSGHPDGLRGDQIPIGSRVIGPCDAYHAMTSPRPWRPAMSHEHAVHELLEGADTQFDPEVVEVLVSHINGLRQASAYLAES